MPTLPTIDLDLNLVHLGWVLLYAGGAMLFTYAAKRCWARRATAEDELMPESILIVARMLFNLCGALALLGWLHTAVGVFAIFRFSEPNVFILMAGAGVFVAAGYAEVSGINALTIAIRREAKDGLWQRMGDVLRVSAQ